MKNIVVAGSINVDLVAHVSRLPLEGETVMGEDFTTCSGGKGANQAVAAARLGGNVMMVGRLGQGAFADQLRRDLEDAGVDTTCVLNVDQPSGTAVITVTANGGNSIVVMPGANAALRPQDLRQHMHLLRGADILLAQLEIPLDTVQELGALALEFGISFLLDPAPAQVLPTELLRTVTWLTPNERETLALLEHLGHPAPGDVQQDDDIAAAAERILATGVRNVILKLGSRGVYVAGKDVSAQFIAGFPVEAVDTTAAGDAFNGGFAYGLTQGMPPVEAARFANAAAAVSVTRSGAQPSMPVRADVEELMAAREI